MEMMSPRISVIWRSLQSVVANEPSWRESEPFKLLSDPSSLFLISSFLSRVGRQLENAPLSECHLGTPSQEPELCRQYGSLRTILIFREGGLFAARKVNQALYLSARAYKTGNSLMGFIGGKKKESVLILRN